MPKPVNAKPEGRRAPPNPGKAAGNNKISDPRFASFETDPRFRLPSKRQAKTKLDKRFAGMLKDEEFTAVSRVDRYGRKIKSDSKKKALQRLYEAEDDEEEDGDDGAEQDEDGDSDGEEDQDDDKAVRKELRVVDKKYDPARGGGFDASDSDSDSDDSDDESEAEDDEPEGVGRASIQRYQEEQSSVPTGEVTNRIAIVNIDWDHIKSTDLFALLSSFVPSAGGRIEKISIYPSEFGKERMQQEELEGPPREIFRKEEKKMKKKKADESEDEEREEEEEGTEEEDDDELIKKQLLEEGDDQDFDSDALRSYQLDRLRYFYAVMVCSDKATAEQIYREVDGREYQTSSNFMDLRFIPDDTTFDDEPRDECDGVLPPGYKPVEFVTNALQHSKVKLTWDMHPDEAERKDRMHRAFTGSRNDIAENDLRAYLASDSEGEEDDDDDVDAAEAQDVPAADEERDAEEPEQPKLSKKELARRKMREALGLGAEEEAEKPAKGAKDGPVGDMQITFTPALTGKPSKSGSKGAAAAAAEEGETTIEKYARKERERKEKKREMARARREGLDPEAVVAKGGAAKGGDADEGATQDLGFDDPFFMTAEEPEKQVSKASVRKEERKQKREAREAAEKASAAERAKLELLMADDTTTPTAAGSASTPRTAKQHFDMNEILKEEKRKTKAEKLKGKKARKEKEKQSKQQQDGNLLQQGFEMDVDDARFEAVFEDHEFAIDPSNPRFKATSGMKKLLEKGRNKRKAGADGVEKNGSKKARTTWTTTGEEGSGDLAGLVESVKKKARRH